jgi:hypothetical protein
VKTTGSTKKIELLPLSESLSIRSQKLSTLYSSVSPVRTIRLINLLRSLGWTSWSLSAEEVNSDLEKA